jgi:hypothetical protein
MFTERGAPPRELFFDPFLTCNHPGFAGLVGELMGAALEPRRRQRRLSNIKAIKRVVSAVVANLLRRLSLAQSSQPNTE